MSPFWVGYAIAVPAGIIVARPVNPSLLKRNINAWAEEAIGLTRELNPKKEAPEKGAEPKKQWSPFDLLTVNPAMEAPMTKTPKVRPAAQEVSRPAVKAPEPQAKPPTEAPARRTFANSIGMSFVLIPAGSFRMGSPGGEPERDPDERQHPVTISKRFYLQTTEVTQKQWTQVMGSNPSHFKDCGGDCPVDSVSWEDAQEFIRRLNQQERVNKYRLPTEAEWEYGCRAGTSTPFCTGRCVSTNQANYNGNSPLSGCPKGENRKRPLPVSSFPANPWGLYDMHGNVWEWCQDWYGDYPTGHVTDPTGPASGEKRVLRGGSWVCVAWGIRSAIRSWLRPGDRGGVIGFRLARDV